MPLLEELLAALKTKTPVQGKAHEMLVKIENEIPEELFGHKVTAEAIEGALPKILDPVRAPKASPVSPEWF